MKTVAAIQQGVNITVSHNFPTFKSPIYHTSPTLCTVFRRKGSYYTFVYILLLNDVMRNHLEYFEKSLIVEQDATA